MSRPFTFEAEATGPEGTRTFTFQTNGFDATSVVTAEAEKLLREGEELTDVVRVVEATHE